MWNSPMPSHMTQSEAERLLAFLESVGLFCTIHMDPSGSLVERKEALKNFLRLTDDIHNLFDLVPCHDQSRFAALLTRALKEQTPKEVKLDLIINREGLSVLVPSHVIAVPMGDPEHLLKMLLFHRHQSHHFATDDLQNHKLFNLGALSAGIAHDLNNLFTGIGAFNSLLAQRLDHPQQLRYSQAIQTTLDKAANLTGAILDYLKKDQSAHKLMDPMRCLRDMTRLAERTVGEGIKFSVSIPKEEWPISLKRSELGQILLNLVINARDALQGQGQIRVAAEYYPQPTPHSLRLIVEDNGSGISPDDLARVFDPFFTTKGGSGGTGLGLAVIHHLVTKAAGTVGVESVPGQFTRFTLDLPLSPE